jgi:hypothetical protein
MPEAEQLQILTAHLHAIYPAGPEAFYRFILYLTN